MPVERRLDDVVHGLDLAKSWVELAVNVVRSPHTSRTPEVLTLPTTNNKLAQAREAIIVTCQII